MRTKRRRSARPNRGSSQPQNTVTLLVDGEATYPAMLEAIAGAQQTVVVASYIFAADPTGRRFCEALTACARRSVAVRVLIDGVGSMGTSQSFFASLIAAGGEVRVFRPPQPWRPAWGFWHRDHRKILVVDDHLGFVGGLNIGDDYAPDAWGGEAWHDMHAGVRGPAAREMTKLFNRTWRWVTGQCWNNRLAPPRGDGTVAVRVLENRFQQRHAIHRAYLQAIKSARRTVRITNAYFVPPRSVVRALRNAVRRGVAVQLLLAGQTDLPFVQYASRAMYRALLRCGIEIYEWNERILHAKCAVIDGEWCSVGSYNLNRRSLLHNLEANISCRDHALGAQLDAQFACDLTRSLRVDPATWHRRSAGQKLLERLFFQLRFFL